MNPRLLLLASLLSTCSGSSSVRRPPATVLAFAGGDVVLPCSFSVAPGDDVDDSVEWSKRGLRPDVVLLYRDGCETHEMKNPAFRYRTSLIANELKNGNLSLRISNVQLEDAGKYQCMRLGRKPPRDVTVVELVVAAVSEPRLSVTSADGVDVVTLQCEATCWLPEPRIRLLDHQGNEIRGDDPKREEDVRGCYTVRRRVVLQDAANRYFHHKVTCRVHQPGTNQTLETEIFLPVQTSYSLTTAIAAGGTLLLLLVLSSGLVVFLWRRCGKSAKEQKLAVTRQSSGGSAQSGTSETHLYSVKVDRADNIADITIEMLTTQVADLKMKLHEKEDTILQLQNNNTSQISAVVGQYDQAKMLYSPSAATSRNPSECGSLPQNNGPKAGQDGDPAPNQPFYRSSRRHSSPALLTLVAAAAAATSSAASTLEKKRNRVARSKSDTRTRPGPNAKSQRRNSSVFPFLPDLAEESELLLA